MADITGAEQHDGSVGVWGIETTTTHSTEQAKIGEKGARENGLAGFDWLDWLTPWVSGLYFLGSWLTDKTNCVTSK